MENTKTIFITVFTGIEGKNLLRTPFISLLLKNPLLNLVLLVTSKERKEYLKNEFKNNRLTFEVVEEKKMKPLDSFFAHLRYYLINTETTRLRARLLRDSGGTFIGYFLKRLAHFVLARRFIRSCVRKLDEVLIKDMTYTALFDKYSPELVFCAQAFDEIESHLIREAKKRKVKTITYVNTWDKVTARSMFRVLADKFIVFNNIVKQELIETNDVDPKDIFVSGIPQYDQFFNPESLQDTAKMFGLDIPPSMSRAQFFEFICVPIDTQFILYAPMGNEYSNQDWDVIDLLHQHVIEKKYGKAVDFFVRFPPNDFLNDNEIKKRPWLKWYYPAIRFSKKRGSDWDMNFKDLILLTDTLNYASVVVCYASSLSIDAAVFDKPIINLNFEMRREKKLIKSPTKFYKFEHYKKALATNAIKLVEGEEELIRTVRNYLTNPELEREERKRLVSEQCSYIDGKSGQRMVEFLISQLV